MEAKDNFSRRRYVAEVIAGDEVHFLEWGDKSSDANTRANNYDHGGFPQDDLVSNDITPMDDGEDIPFNR